MSYRVEFRGETIGEFDTVGEAVRATAARRGATVRDLKRWPDDAGARE